MSLIRVGVIGVGHHGRHHARNLAAMPDVQLVGVVDAHEPTARAIAESCNTKAYSDPADLLDRVDAVTIAVPTVAHHAVARMFLDRGIAALVEKPLSFSSDEGRDLVQVSRKRDAKLMVGHIERFNPTWSAAATSPPARHVSSTRFSKFPFRSLDVSVVFDVMIHDIDLVLSLVRAPIRTLRSQGAAILSPSLDWAVAQLEFESGQTAEIAASRVHHATERKMTIRAEASTIELDFFRRESVLSTITPVAKARLATLTPAATMDEKNRAWDTMFSTRQTTHAKETEPLRLELDEFLSALREDRDPLVTGEAGLAAVQIARRIEDAVASPIRISRAA